MAEKVEIDASYKIGRCFEVKEAEPGAKGGGETVHYYIELLDSGKISLEMVDEKGMPNGNLLEEISKKEFTQRFKTCSHHECKLQPRTLDEIKRKMADTRAELGKEHLANGELDKAEDKFNRALKFDEDNVKAKFGLGKTYLEQKKEKEAFEIFRELSKIDALFEKENKHTFNEFGIYLRKSGQIDLAIANYEKAILIDPEDEALYFNLGVAYMKMEDYQVAIEKMKEALKIDPDFEEARKHLEIFVKLEEERIKKLLEE